MFFALERCRTVLAAIFTIALAALAVGGASAAAGPDTRDGHGTHVSKTIGGTRFSGNSAKVCCQLPRVGAARLITAKRCKARRGKVVAKAQCAKQLKAKTAKPVTMAQFRIITGREEAKSDNEWRYVPVRRMALFNTAGNPGNKTAADKLTEGIYCKGGNSHPCWCEGANTCKKFRAACVELGGRLKCGGKNKKSQPTYCACSK